MICGDLIGDIICRYLHDNSASSEYVCLYELIKSHINNISDELVKKLKMNNKPSRLRISSLMLALQAGCGDD